MSAKALFVVDGDPYAAIPQRLAIGIIPAKPARGKHEAKEARLMERDRLQAAKAVWAAIVSVLPPGEPVLGFRWTDRMLRQTVWLASYSLRYLQKGLEALEELEIISRKRRGGRRTITVVPCLDAGNKGRASAPHLHRGGPQDPPSIPPPAAVVPDGIAMASEAAAARERVSKAESHLDTAAARGFAIVLSDGSDELRIVAATENHGPLTVSLDRAIRVEYRAEASAIVRRHGGRYPARE